MREGPDPITRARRRAKWREAYQRRKQRDPEKLRAQWREASRRAYERLRAKAAEAGIPLYVLRRDKRRLARERRKQWLRARQLEGLVPVRLLADLHIDDGERPYTFPRGTVLYVTSGLVHLWERVRLAVPAPAPAPSPVGARVIVAPPP